MSCHPGRGFRVPYGQNPQVLIRKGLVLGYGETLSVASDLCRGGEGLTRTADGSEWWSALRSTPQMGWYMAVRVAQGWEGHWQGLGRSPGTGCSGKWSPILVWDQRSPRLVGWGGAWLGSRRSARSHVFPQELSGQGGEKGLSEL